MEGMTLDTTQEVRIVVLQNKVERLEEKQVELLDRLRTVEKWVAGAAAVIAVGGAVVGFAIAADAKPGEQVFINAWADKIRQYELERNLTSPNHSIDGALDKLEENDDGDKFVRSDDGMQVKSIFAIR